MVDIMFLLSKARSSEGQEGMRLTESSICFLKSAKEGGKEGGEPAPKSPRQGQGTPTMNGGFITGLS